MIARFLLWGSLLLVRCGGACLAATPLPLSNAATISLLTCAPGSETYALFGHSALRVADPARGLDRVYNYGTFDFRTPHFYWRFLRGDLRYFLSATSFETFQTAYRQENRALCEQVLALRPGEAQRLYSYLETTLHSPARYYRYQFFADNCTTRLFALVRSNLAAPWQLDSSYVAAPRTYRQLLAPYLAPAPWVNLGMNLGLGWPADQLTTFRQRLFLPTELQAAFAHSTRYQHPFVRHEQLLFAPAPQAVEEQAFSFWFTPTFCLLVIGTLTLAGHYLPARYAFIGRSVRGGLFVLVGLTGCVLLGLQLFSLHTPAHANYQLLWLLPTHVAFGFARPGPRWRGYATVALALLVLGGLLGSALYYARLVPEAGLLLLLLLVYLLLFRRQCPVA